MNWTWVSKWRESICLILSVTSFPPLFGCAFPESESYNNYMFVCLLSYHCKGGLACCWFASRQILILDELMSEALRKRLLFISFSFSFIRPQYYVILLAWLDEWNNTITQIAHRIYKSRNLYCCWSIYSLKITRVLINSIHVIIIITPDFVLCWKLKYLFATISWVCSSFLLLNK
jgi:hypothetical protein